MFVTTAVSSGQSKGKGPVTTQLRITDRERLRGVRPYAKPAGGGFAHGRNVIGKLKQATRQKRAKDKKRPTAEGDIGTMGALGGSAIR